MGPPGNFPAVGDITAPLDTGVDAQFVQGFFDFSLGDIDRNVLNFGPGQFIKDDSNGFYFAPMSGGNTVFENSIGLLKFNAETGAVITNGTSGGGLTIDVSTATGASGEGRNVLYFKSATGETSATLVTDKYNFDFWSQGKADASGVLGNGNWATLQAGGLKINGTKPADRDAGNGAVGEPILLNAAGGGNTTGGVGGVGGSVVISGGLGGNTTRVGRSGGAGGNIIINPGPGGSGSDGNGEVGKVYLASAGGDVCLGNPATCITSWSQAGSANLWVLSGTNNMVPTNSKLPIWGDNNSRTETRDNAGMRGSQGAVSGFFQTNAPVNYPAGASGWWHLIDSRHSSSANNYALQIAGGFFDQNLYFRKTDTATDIDATTAWNKIVAQNSDGKVGIGTDAPLSKFAVVSSATTNAGGITLRSADVDTIITNEGGGSNAGKIQVMSGNTATTIGTTAYTLKIQPEGGDISFGSGNISMGGNLRLTGGAISNWGPITLFADDDNSGDNSINMKQALVRNTYISTDEFSNNFVGYQNDMLIGADRKWKVSVSTPSTDPNALISQLFNGNAGSSYNYPTGVEPSSVTVSVNFNSAQHYLAGLSIYFPYGTSPKNITVRKWATPPPYDCNAAVGSTVTSMTGFAGSLFNLYDRTEEGYNGLGNGICAISFEFSGGFNANYADSRFRIGEIALFRAGHYGEEGNFVTRSAPDGGNRIFSNLGIYGGTSTTTAPSQLLTVQNGNALVSFGNLLFETPFIANPEAFNTSVVKSGGGSLKNVPTMYKVTYGTEFGETKAGAGVDIGSPGAGEIRTLCLNAPTDSRVTQYYIYRKGQVLTDPTNFYRIGTVSVGGAKSGAGSCAGITGYGYDDNGATDGFRIDPPKVNTVAAGVYLKDERSSSAYAPLMRFGRTDDGLKNFVGINTERSSYTLQVGGSTNGIDSANINSFGGAFDGTNVGPVNFTFNGGQYYPYAVYAP